METSEPAATPDDASTALAEAEASRARFTDAIAPPSHFYGPIAAAVAIQIATTAFGATDGRGWARGVLLGGLVLFAVVAGVQISRFKRRNGVQIRGLSSRVVLGTATAASTAYIVALGAAVWAAAERVWWLVALGAIAGGVAYPLSGRRWWRTYQGDPATHGPGDSVVWVAVCSAFAVAGVVLLAVAG